MRGEPLHGKRAQSSIEYLGTYAWAFLGLILTVGALNYFGIFNPSGYTPEQCESGSQISCQDVAVFTKPQTGQTTLMILLQNNYPRNITIKGMTLKTASGELDSQQSDIVVEPGRTATLTFGWNEQVVAGQKEQFSYTIEYHRYGGTFDHDIAGTATVNVQQQQSSPPYCGNGAQEGAEECDPPRTIEGNEGSWGTAACGSKACLSDCTCAP